MDDLLGKIIEAGERDRKILANVIFVHHTLCVLSGGPTITMEGQSWKLDISRELEKMAEVMEMLGIVPGDELICPDGYFHPEGE